MNDSRIHRNMKIAWDDSAAKLGPMTDVTFHSTHLKGIRASSYFFYAAYVVSEACFTAMTGDHHDE